MLPAYRQAGVRLHQFYSTPGALRLTPAWQAINESAMYKIIKVYNVI